MLKALGDIKNPSFIDFDRDSNTSDIKERLTSNPDYADIYDGDLYQNSTQMIINIFSFLFEKNAEYFNKSIFEGFLHKCRSTTSIYDHLKEKHLNAIQATEASIEVQATLLNNAYMRNQVNIPLFTKVYAKGLDGSKIPFEFINYDSTNGYDYFGNVSIIPSDTMRDWFSVELYSGETFSQEIEIPTTGIEHVTFALSDHKEIIENSIQVYYYKDGTYVKLSPTTTFVAELEVDELNIFNQSNGQEGKPYYMLNYTSEGSASITFGSSDFGGIIPSQLRSNGERLIVFGRKNGGGKYANIVKGALSTTLTLSDISGNEFSAKIINITSGAGGHDRETALEAQVNAPLRYGRGGAIVNDIDAKNMLKSIAVKHTITTSTPDGETAQIVPILHAFHQIVPKDRDFDNFVFPDVLDDDTSTIYLARFLSALDDFCNVKGINATAVSQTSLIDSFAYASNNSYNLTQNLSLSSVPFYGTLYIDALNRNGALVDRVKWSGSYNSDEVTSANITEHAIFTTPIITAQTLKIGSLRLIFSMGAASSVNYRFDITLTAGAYTIKTLADTIQAAVLYQIENNAYLASVFANYTDYEFVSYEATSASTGTIIFKCPFIGIDSKIIFWASTDNKESTSGLYSLFGLTMVNNGTQSKPFRPAYQTGLVFDSGCIYYPKNSKQDVNLKIKSDVMNNQTYTWKLNPVQSSSDQTGSTITDLYIYEEDYTTLMSLQADQDVTLKFFLGDDLVGTALFEDVQIKNNNIVTLGDGANNILYADTSKTTLDLVNSKLTLRLLNGTAISTYTQSYTSIKLIKVFMLDANGSRLSIPAPSIFTESNNEWTQDITSATAKTWSQTLSGLSDGSFYDIVFYSDINGSNEIYALTIQYEASQSHVALMSANCILATSPAYSKTADAENVTLGTNGLLSITFSTPIENSDPYYIKGFTSFDSVQLVFNRKSYTSMVMSYTPNKYNPTGEAAIITGLLKSQKKRLLSMEHLIKPLEFIPRPIHVNATIYKNYSIDEAKRVIYNAIMDCMGYNNIYSKNTIGRLPTEDEVKAYIISKATNIGLINLTLSDYSDSVITANNLTYAYYFTFDNDMKKRLADLEDKYNTIFASGDLSELMCVTISITQQAV